jgi:plasmid stability protein
MTQVTLRKVPDELAERLRQAAKADGRSMNSLAIELLTEQLGLAKKSRRKRRDLSRFSGAWSEADATEFAANTSSFSAIDDEVWQ